MEYIRTISPGRLISNKGSLKQNISDPNSLFVEIKDKMFEYYLPRYYSHYNKFNKVLKQKEMIIEKLNNKIIDLITKIQDLKQIIGRKTS